MQHKPVESMIPHRPPFLFVDRILELTPNSILCQKSISISDPYMVLSDDGKHYVSEIILIECILQSGAYLMASRSNISEIKKEKRMYFVGSPLTSLGTKPSIGDTLNVEVELTQELKQMARLKGKIIRSSDLVLEGVFMVVEKR
jgi:3-hydroxymyristoyl/3-hydroxydecanoyl-(acyl carrier protein) dehydratase